MACSGTALPFFYFLHWPVNCVLVQFCILPLQNSSDCERVLLSVSLNFAHGVHLWASYDSQNKKSGVSVCVIVVDNIKM
jgi:hypothetical protein